MTRQTRDLGNGNWPQHHRPAAVPGSPSKPNQPFPLKLALTGTRKLSIYSTKFQLLPVNHFLVRADLNSKASFTGMNTEMSGLELQGAQWEKHFTQGTDL